MKRYYIEVTDREFCDEKKHYSIDGKRAFVELSGKEAYDYLAEHKDLRFYETSTAEEFGNTVFVEVPKHQIKNAEAWKNHENYVKRTMRECGREVVSLSRPITEDGDFTLEDITGNSDESVEDKVIRNLDLEILHRALHSLSKEEYRIIECLYLADETMTERALAQVLGKSQPYIHRLKMKIFDKIRKFF